MKKKNILLISILCIVILATNSLFVFANTNTDEQSLDLEAIKVSKEDLSNGSMVYGLTIENDGNVSTQPINRAIDFGFESYDGILDVQMWEGTQIMFSIRLHSTNAKMLSHTGTISIYDVGFLGLIGDLYNSMTFKIKGNIPTTILSQTYKMNVGNNEEIWIKLTNLRVTRAKDGMILSIPNAQRKIDKEDV